MTEGRSRGRNRRATDRPIQPPPAPKPEAKRPDWSRDAIEELLVVLREFAKHPPQSDAFYLNAGRVLGTAAKHKLL